MSGSRTVKIAFLSLVLAASGACQRAPRWNVLLVTFDTTRADHIGSYGDKKATPNLDALAAQGTRFAHAYAAAPITAPSHSTILTGKYPIAHGFRDNALFVLEDKHVTLAEVLSEAGYSTAAAIGSFPLIARWGLDQGFDLYDDHISGKYENVLGDRVLEKKDIYFEERPASRVNDAVLPWLHDIDNRPFFLWLHYFDPHQPYLAPSPYDQLYPGDPYLAEIAYSDEAFGNVVRHLKELGEWENTLVVFTSDHGEGLDEHHEATHSMLLYDTTLHVPLIVRMPSQDGGQVIDTRVGLVDLLPTVLDLLELPIPQDVQGRSLAKSVRSGVEPDPTELYAETLSPRLAHGWGELRALIDGDRKYVFGPRPELFDLGADPSELTDLSSIEVDMADRLQRRLATFLRENAAKDLAGPGQLDTETRERLQALGYLTGGAELDEPILEELRPGGPAPQDRVLDITQLSLAKTFFRNGQTLRARQLILELLEKTPDSPLYLESLLNAEVLLGRADAAVELLDQVAGRTADDELTARMYVHTAGLFAEQGEWDRALDLVRRSVELRPTGDAHYFEARVLARLGRPDERMAALEKALALEPRHVSSRVAYAVELIRRERFEEGETHLLQAMLDYPLYPKTYFNYGMLAQQMGDAETARSNFERAIRLDPNYTLARRGLVMLLAAIGDREGAEQALEQLLEVAPNSQDAAIAARAVREGS